MSEIAPDIKVTTQRFRLVELGDGNQYRASMSSFGDIGNNLARLIAAFDAEEKELGKRDIAWQFIQSSLGAFYSKERVQELRDFVGIDHFWLFVDAYHASDAKKNSTDANSPKPNTAQS